MKTKQHQVSQKGVQKFDHIAPITRMHNLEGINTTKLRTQDFKRWNK